MLPQDTIDRRLVFAAARLEPFDDVGIEADGHDLLSRPIKLADFSLIPVRYLCNIPRVDRLIGTFSQSGKLCPLPRIRPDSARVRFSSPCAPR